MEIEEQERRTKMFGLGELFAVVAVLCISFAAVWQRAASVNVNPILGSFINIIPIFLTGIIYMWLSKRTTGTAFGKPNRRAIAAGIGGAVASNVIALPIFLVALSYGGAIIATPSVASSVIWASVFARIMLGQRFSKFSFLGFGIFAVGLILLSVGQISGYPLSPRWFLAIPLSLVVAILYGITMSLTGYSLANGLSRSGSIGINGITGLIGLGILVLIQENSGTLFLPDTLRLIMAGALQAIGLFASTAAFAKTTVMRVGTILVTNIIWTSLLSWVFLDEDINFLMGVSLGIALFGLTIVQFSSSNRKKGIAPNRERDQQVASELGE